VRLTRVLCAAPLAAGAEVALPAAAASHTARVLRLRSGDALVVFDGRGADFRAEIAQVAGSDVRVRLLERIPARPESPLAITLVQAISRGERMDLTLQKATELGVRVIAPVASARSVVRLDARQAEAKLRHWRAVVAAACEQCGRSRLPELRPPAPLSTHLAQAARDGGRLVLDPDAAIELAALPGLAAQVELLIGPEGGLEDAELAAAKTAGYQSVRMGPRVLRTETAGIVALAVLQSRWGDLAGPRGPEVTATAQDVR
jgi:16S rRNA (uracil1498-N3)-methyltransferase